MSRPPGAGTKLSTRFIASFAITYLGLIGIMGVVVDRTARDAMVESVDANLAVAGQLAKEALPANTGAYGEWAQSVFDAGGLRATLIRSDGVVLADSHIDPAVMENHLDRPEVQQALDGSVGEAQRVSDSTGFEQRYVALPPEAGLIVRTSLPTRVVDDELWAVRRSIIVAAGVIGLLGIGLMALLSRRLAKPITELTGQAIAVAEGGANVSPRRSSVRELDQLGVALATMGDRLGSRVSVAEETTATLEVVLGALPEGTILIGGDDRVLYANDAARRILGEVPDDLSQLTPIQVQAAVIEARAAGRPEERVLDHGNPTRRVEVVVTPFSGEDRVLVLVADITQQDRVDSVRRDFVANASHELKTPVSTIIASSEALRIALAREDDSVSGFAEQIESSARQLDRLVADLLDLSRLERDQPEMAPARVDHIVREEVGRALEAAEGKGVALTVETRPVVASVNQRDVAIAVRNVLENAIHHTSESGSVAVRVGIDDGAVVIAVTDTGVGIPTRDLDRIFERFYRVDSARSRSTGGTGLGLAIVKHVAEGHGGHVAVTSELGVGSTFAITLPGGEEPGGN